MNEEKCFCDKKYVGVTIRETHWNDEQKHLKRKPKPVKHLGDNAFCKFPWEILYFAPRRKTLEVFFIA